MGRDKTASQLFGSSVLGLKVLMSLCMFKYIKGNIF